MTLKNPTNNDQKTKNKNLNDLKDDVYQNQPDILKNNYKDTDIQLLNQKPKVKNTELKTTQSKIQEQNTEIINSNEALEKKIQ